MKERIALTIGLLVAGLLVLSACGGDATDETTVTFSGDACTYAGASTFDADTELTIEVINETERSFGFAVWKVPDGTTVEDIQTRGIFTVAGDDENMRAVTAPGSVPSRELMVVLDTSGSWALNCFIAGQGLDRREDSEGYAAVVVEVR